MASNLVRKQITDKNGVSSTRWVKPESASAGASKIPAPSVTLSGSEEAKRIGDEIRSCVEDHHRWNENHFEQLKALVEKNDVDSLKVVQRMLPLNHNYMPGTIRFFVDQLRSKGHGNSIELVTEESLRGRELLMDALHEYGKKRGIPFFGSRSEASMEVCLMAFTDTQDTLNIVSLISERGLMSPDEIRGILSNMNESPVPLQKGTL